MKYIHQTESQEAVVAMSYIEVCWLADVVGVALDESGLYNDSDPFDATKTRCRPDCDPAKTNTDPKRLEWFNKMYSMLTELEDLTNNFKTPPRHRTF